MRFIFPYLFISLVLAGCWSGETSTPPWAPYSDDMTPVDYHLKHESKPTIHFKVPKAYLGRADLVKALGGNILYIHTGLPNLEPRKGQFQITAKQGTAEYENQYEMRKNGLIIHLRGKSRTSQISIKNRKKWIKQKGIKFTESKFKGLKKQVFDDTCHDRHIYNRYGGVRGCDLGKPISYWSFDGDPYKWSINDDYHQWRYYYCTPYLKNSVCRASTTFKGLHVGYIFYVSEIDRLEEIEIGVQNILSRFYVDSIETNL